MRDNCQCHMGCKILWNTPHTMENLRKEETRLGSISS